MRENVEYDENIGKYIEILFYFLGKLMKFCYVVGAEGGDVDSYSAAAFNGTSTLL